MKLTIKTLHGSRFSFGKPKHPNEMPFEGTLLLTDVPSDKAPHGSNNHRIMVPTSVAASSLKSIEGMGLNYSIRLDGHDVRRKVGVIQAAWIEGNEVKVKGIIWKKDFPEAVRDLRGKADVLGMSMEVSEVSVEDPNADVWKIVGLTFTGATVLKAKSAAYHETTLAASAAKETGGITVDKNKAKKKAAKKTEAQTLVEGITAAFQKVVEPLIAGQKAQSKVLVKTAKGIEALQASATVKKEKVTVKPEDELEQLLNAEAEDIEAEADEEEEIDAEADDTDEEIEAEADDEEESEDEDEPEDSEEEEEMEASAEEETEEVAEPAVKQPSNKFEILAQKAAGKIKTLQAMASKQSSQIKKQARIINKLEAQADRYAERLDRRTLPAEHSALLAKAGINASDLMASGNKLTVDEVDQAIATAASQGIQLQTQERMHFKNILLQAGLMEDGRIERNYRN